jgi:general secretion pathway protein G
MRFNSSTRRHRAGGFTLIEILVVVVIVGILGAIIVYRLDNFTYPSTEQGLEALVSKPAGFPEPKNYSPDGYIKSLPTDPWGSPYVYERDGDVFLLFSLGADGAEGGDGLNADISYGDL